MKGKGHVRGQGTLAGPGRRVANLQKLKADLKQAEEALRESEFCYRALVDASPHGVVIGHTPPPRLFFVNSSFAGLVGSSPEDLTSFNPEGVDALLHPLDRDLVLQRWGERLEGKSPPSQYGFRLIRKDGTVIWVEACASRVEYRGKRAVQAVLADVTESRRKDEQLRRLYEDFHEVEEQTAELRRLNEQLLSDTEQRKEGEQALGERLAELEGNIREVEEVNAALRVLLRKAEAQRKGPGDDISATLEDRTVYVAGPRKLQNELIASCIEQATRARCVVGDDLGRLLPAGVASPGVRPGLVLLDCQGKDLRTLVAELRVHLKPRQDRNHVVLFNLSRGQGIERKCISEGIRGFFYEQDSLDLFVKGIRAVFDGQLWLSREVMTRCILEGADQKESARGARESLTPRQIEILALVAVGARDEVIADRLCISAHTARTHVYNIFKKIKVSNRLEAALWAAKNL